MEPHFYTLCRRYRVVLVQSGMWVVQRQHAALAGAWVDLPARRYPDSGMACQAACIISAVNREG